MDAALTNATLVDRRDLGASSTIVRVRPDRQPLPPFEPGQFVQVGLPEIAPERPGKEPRSDGGERAPRLRIAKRAYSIASSARERESYELFLTLVPEGRLTPRLWKLEPGARCWVDDVARGSFTLEGVPSSADLAMVATGTGIAPFVSMLRTYGATRGGDAARWRRFVLVHGVRHAADLAYREELEARARVDACFRYVPVVSREPEPWTGLRGRVQAALEDECFRGLGCGPLDPTSFHVFLCGNPDMIQSVRELLAPRGFELSKADAGGTLHVEKYW